MGTINLTPGYSSRYIPGKCVRCIAEDEMNSCLKLLLSDESDSSELKRKYEALVSFLQSPESIKLKEESERLLADGRHPTLRIQFCDDEPIYQLLVE